MRIVHRFVRGPHRRERGTSPAGGESLYWADAIRLRDEEIARLATSLEDFTPRKPSSIALKREDALRLRDEFLERLKQRLEEVGSLEELADEDTTFSLSGQDLRGIHLEDVDFRGDIEKDGQLSFWHTDLRGAHLDGAFLQGAWLGDCNLEEAHLESANLQGASLHDANLRKAYFRGANLSEAELTAADMEGTVFWEANLQRASLWQAKLRQTDFRLADLREAVLWEADAEEILVWRANLQGVGLRGCPWQEAVDLGDAEWGNYHLEEERSGELGRAASLYRNLKIWHNQEALYDRAGEFFYREMECKRKATSFRQNLGQWLWLNLLWGPLGYGEKPARVVGYGILVWLLFATAYFAAGVFWGLVTPDPLFALYLSAVSFTAVGYGPWIDKSFLVGWVQGLAAFESFVGVFMIAVFVTTFVRKMTR